MIMRFSFAVTGNIRFLSHLDFMQIWGRAARRAGVPIAYSQGFNPHPKLAFTPPRGVGMAGLNEYGDMELSLDMTGEEFLAKMSDALPRGVRVLTATPLTRKQESLMSFVNYAKYEIELPLDLDVDLASEIERIMALDTLIFVRRTPKGTKKSDLRPGIDGMELIDGKLQLNIILGKGGRPADLLTSLGINSNFCKITRLGLWHRDEVGTLITPKEVE